MTQLIGELGGGAEALEDVRDDLLAAATAQARVGAVAAPAAQGDEERRAEGGLAERARSRSQRIIARVAVGERRTRR
jgi:hypothetical protein